MSEKAHKCFFTGFAIGVGLMIAVGLCFASKLSQEIRRDNAKLAEARDQCSKLTVENLDLRKTVTNQAAAIAKFDPSPEPTPAPIDYRPNFAALNKQFAQLLERSVVKKPECNKCHK